MASPDVAVVGAGAAGLVAAWRAAKKGAKVVLLEKTNRIGTKILMSGGGKCNITHAGPTESVLRAFMKNEAVFLRPSFYRFTNEQVVRLLEERGLSVYVRPNGRVFPVEQTARDVVQIIEGLVREAGVWVRKSEAVEGLVLEGGRCGGVVSERGEILAGATVVTVGGKSFPKSGTTGDGYRWLTEAGHSIVPVRAALSPIDLHGHDAELAGVAVRGCVLKARHKGKVIGQFRDDVLFTHHGVSGPAALEVSRSVAEAGNQGVTLEIDLLPDRSVEAVGSDWQAWKARHPNQRVLGQVEGLVPKSLAPVFLGSCGIDGSATGQSLKKSDVNRIAAGLKAWQIGEVKRAVLERGEVVAGGVSLDEVDPQTMASKVVAGLFLAGEILDVAGPVGGYNLQAAWSTGFVAGESAAGSVLG